MADNANINEIIEIKIDIPAFKKNLQEAEAAYENFIQSINKAGNGVKVGKTGAQFSFIADNIKQLTTIIAQQSEIFSSALDTFTGKAGASAEKGAKTLEKAISEAKKISTDGPLFGPGTPEGAREASENRKAEIANNKRAQKEFAERVKSDFIEYERLANQQVANETARAKAISQIDVDAANRRKNILNSQLEAQAEEYNRLARLDKAKQVIFDKAQDRAARQRLKALSDEEKAEEKNAQAIANLKQRVIDAALLRAAKSRERAAKQEDAATQARITKEVAAEEKIIAAKGRLLLKYQQVKDAATKANASLPEGFEDRFANTLKFANSKAPQRDRQADLANTLKYLSQQEKAVSEVFKKNEKAAQGFFDKLTGNFAASAGTAIKYALIFKAFSATLQAAAFAIEAPFLAIRRGVGYLSQLETDSAGIEQALLRSVNFTGGVAENLDKARILARQLAAEIEEVSAELNISEAVLNDIARLSIQGGVFNFIKEKDDLLAFVKAYAIAVKSTVASAQAGGSLAIASSITEISDLFSSKGTGLSDNKFLKGLNLSSERWIQIRDSSREYRDLIRQLQPEFDKLNLSVVSVSGTFSALTNSATILVNRLLGLGAIKIFEFLVDGLKQFIRFLKDNESVVIDIFEKFNNIILAIGKQLASLFKDTDFRPFLENFVVLTLVAKNLLSILITTGRVLSAINELPETRNFEPIGKLFTEFNESIKESDRLLEDFKNALYGKNSAKKKLIDVGTIDPKGLPREDVTKTTGLGTKTFEEERSKFQVQIELVKEKYNELRQVEIEAETERLISRRELARRVEDLNDKEIAELDNFYKQIQAASQKAAAISLSTEVDPVKRAEIQKRFSTLFYQTELQRLKDAESLRKTGRQFDKQGVKEAFDIEKEGFKATRELEQKELELRRDLIKAELDNGLRTRVEAADAEAAVEEKTLANRKRDLEENIDAIAEGHADRAKLEKELELLLKDINIRALVRAAVRRKAEDEDRRAAEDHITKMRELVSKSEQDRLQFFNSLTGDNRYINSLDKILSRRAEDLRLAEKQKIAELELAKARNESTDQVRKLEEQVAQAGQARFDTLKERVSNIDQLRSGSLQSTLRSALLRKALREAEAFQEASRREAVESTIRFEENSPQVQAAFRLLESSKAISDAFRSLVAATKSVKEVFLSGVSNLLNLDLKAIFGKNGLLTKENASGIARFAGGVALAGAAIEAFANIVDAAKQGFANGGVLGGIGAVGSIVGTALKDVPVVGALVQGFSQAFTAIGALLTRSAKNLADKLQRQFDSTIAAFADGDATLVATLQAAQEQRNAAIAQLSGKKGGKAELDKLLPGFDSEIKNLLKQQQEIIKAFEKELQLLNLQSDVLSETATAWDSINQKVKEYIGAGGDAAKAAQFLELQVGKLRQQAVEELNSAEQQALQQMLSFNNLLKDRQKLIDDFRKKEFDLIAGGAIERRGAGAVLRGRELAELRQQFNEQLAALDDQIRLETIRVERTKEVFNITNDIAELKRRDEAFTLAALDAQINRWKQLQELVKGIANGGQGFLNGIAPSNSNIFNVTINAGAGADGSAIAQSFSQEMESRFRQGLF